MIKEKKKIYPREKCSYVVSGLVVCFSWGRGEGLLTACTMALRAVAVNSEIGTVFLVFFFVGTARKMAILGGSDDPFG